MLLEQKTIIVSDEMHEVCPQFVGAAVYAEFVNTPYNTALWQEIDRYLAEYTKTQTVDTIKLIPAIEATRAVYRRCGKDPSRYRPSGEALIRRVLKGKDIREFGSKNAGLTNVHRVFGKGPAIATLVCDLLKGVLGVVICRIVVHKLFGVTFFDDPHFIGYVAGLCVNLGHCFPVFYGFHGGKGVLIAATTLLAIDPVTCCFSLAACRACPPFGTGAPRCSRP